MYNDMNSKCHDTRECFARRKDGCCTLLWDTVFPADKPCPYAKPCRLVSKGKAYPWDGHAGEYKKALKMVDKANK